MIKALTARGVVRAVPILLVVVMLNTTTDAQTSARAGAPQHGNAAFAAAWERGTPMTVTGELTVIYADDFKNDRSELAQMIRDERTGKSFQLRFETEAPRHLRTGQRVTISGRSVNSDIYVAACCDGTSISSSNIQTLSQSTAAVTGDQRTLVMIANFADSSVSCSADAIDNSMFADPAGLSVDGLYRASSDGQVSFSGRVVGPFALTSSSTEPCNISGWADSADALAAASGVDVASYPHKMYVMPANNCPAAGMGTVGGNPSRAWIFMCGTKGLFAHEVGHNLGMDHASTPTEEYGDSTDPMAISTWQLHGVNAPHRHELGWFAPAAVTPVNQSGFYDLAPLALDPALASAPQAIMIAKPDTAEYYYVSYRVPIGFDNYIDGSYYYRLSIHRYKGDGSPTRTFLLAGLADGESFVDQVNGITITQVRHDSTHTTAKVQFTSACTAGTPAVTISPQTQSGPAGTSMSYTVSVSNLDTPACAPSTFALTRAVPAGWTGVLSTTSLTLGPGGTGQATLVMTSPAVVPSGTYGATVSTSDALNALHSSSAPASYVVQPPADTVSPSAPLNLKTNVSQKLKQIQLSWSAASDNVTVAGYRLSRNGTVIGTPTTTGWIDRAYTAGATFTYSVVAVDAAGNLSAPSNSVTVALSSGGRK